MSRYIDANSLYQKINDWRNQIKTTCGEYDDYVECLGEVLTMIGSEPNADVAERKKGRWIGKPIAGYCTVRCSVCKNVFSENNGRWNFCPNCGADMREEKTDETD